MHLRPPTSPLFPYTTLFRSAAAQRRSLDDIDQIVAAHGLRVDELLVAAARDVVVDVLRVDDAAVLHHPAPLDLHPVEIDRKSTRLNSSHRCISYAVFCLKKK